MGKLFKIILNSIIFAAVKAQDDPTFLVAGCNADVSPENIKTEYQESRPFGSNECYILFLSCTDSPVQSELI